MDEETFAEQRSLYLQDVQSRYTNVKDEMSGEDVRVDDLVYADSTEAQAQVPSASLPNDLTVDVDVPPRVLVQGYAGSGKSWLLIKTLVHLTREAAAVKSAPVPLFVPAVKLARHVPPTLEAYLAGLYSSGVGARNSTANRHAFLLECLKRGCFALLVDGLDETARYRPEVAEYIVLMAQGQKKTVVAARPEIRFWLSPSLFSSWQRLELPLLSVSLQKHVVSSRCTPPCLCSPLLQLLSHEVGSEISQCTLGLALARQLIHERGAEGLVDAHVQLEVEEAERCNNEMVGGGMLRRMLVEGLTRELLHAHDARKYLIGSSDFDRDREGDIKLLASSDAQTMLEALAEVAFQRDRSAALAVATSSLEQRDAGGAAGHDVSTADTNGCSNDRYFTDADVAALVEGVPSFGSIWSVMFKISPLIEWPDVGQGLGYESLGVAPTNDNSETQEEEHKYRFKFISMLHFLYAKRILKRLGKELQDASNELERATVLNTTFDDHLLYNKRHFEVLQLCGVMARADVFESIVCHLVGKDDASGAASFIALQLIKERPMDDRHRPKIVAAMNDAVSRGRVLPFLRLMLHPSVDMRVQAVQQFKSCGLDDSAVGLDLLQTVARPSDSLPWFEKMAAAHALGLLGANEQVVVDALTWLAGNDDEWIVARQEAVIALSKLDPTTGNLVAQLCAGLRVWPQEVSGSALRVLKQAQFVNVLLEHADDIDVVRALVLLGVQDARLVTQLQAKLEDPDPLWRCVAATSIDTLSHSAPPSAAVVETVISRVRDPQPSVRIAIANALGSTRITNTPEKAQDVAKTLVNALRVERAPDARTTLSDALCVLCKTYPNQWVAELLTELLQPSDNSENATNASELQLVAIDIVRTCGQTSDAVADTLSHLLKDESAFIRVKAAAALLSVCGHSHRDYAYETIVSILQDRSCEYSARVAAVHAVTSRVKVESENADAVDTDSAEPIPIPDSVANALITLFHAAVDPEGPVVGSEEHSNNLRIEVLHTISAVKFCGPNVFQLLTSLSLDAPDVHLTVPLQLEALQCIAALGLSKCAPHVMQSLFESLLELTRSDDASIRLHAAAAIGAVADSLTAADRMSVSLQLLDLVNDIDDGVCEESLRALRRVDTAESTIVEHIAKSLQGHCVLDLSVHQLKARVDKDDGRRTRSNHWRLRQCRLLGRLPATSRNKKCVELLFAIVDMMLGESDEDRGADMALQVEAIRTLGTLAQLRDSDTVLDQKSLLTKLTDIAETNSATPLALEAASALVGVGVVSTGVVYMLARVLGAPGTSERSKSRAVHVLLASNTLNQAHVANALWKLLDESDGELRALAYDAVVQVLGTTEQGHIDLSGWLTTLSDKKCAPLAFQVLVQYVHLECKRDPSWILPAFGHRELKRQIAAPNATIESIMLLRLLRLNGRLGVLPVDKPKTWLQGFKSMW